MLLPEYQSNDTENESWPALFQVCPITLSNLHGFNQQVLPIDMEDFQQETSFESLQERMKMTNKLNIFKTVFFEIMNHRVLSVEKIPKVR